MVLTLYLFSFCTFIMHTFAYFTLNGQQGSFAKFPAWKPCLNGSFSFQFRTEHQNALLVYLDHGNFKFFELKLVGGNLRLRVNFAEGTVIVRAGEMLDDGKWHKVEVRQENQRSVLIVDDEMQSRTAPDKASDLVETLSDAKIFMYFGGLPKEFDNRLLLLALPSVVFEPRFEGSIRKLSLKNCGAEQHRPEVVDSFGLRLEYVNICEELNPCLNNGVCKSHDNELLCDCTKTDFEGFHCEIGMYAL